MPTNKNAIIRYQILDECLSDRYHDYTLDDLTAKVNDYFKEINPDHVDITRFTKDFRKAFTSKQCIRTNNYKRHKRSAKNRYSETDWREERRLLED